MATHDAALTGRIALAPSAVVHSQILEPQFRHDVEHHLRFTVLVEKVLLLEYRRMGVLDAAACRALFEALSRAAAGDLAADPVANLSDLAFALERRAAAALPEPVPAWHVDRSRNDLQATSQLLAGRDQMVRLADALVECARAALALAGRHVDDVLPGYTHLQPAQVISPGFYFSALAGHLLTTVDNLGLLYDRVSRSPLGAGAMAGQDLPWDRDRLAGLLGLAGTEPHALVAVASRTWQLELAAACSTFAVVLSRYLTDLMNWCGGEYAYFALPDDLAGISSAMPQKKNYPILERLRGRTAHLTSWYVDVAMAQRGTPFSNSVEVGKEAASGQAAALSGLCGLLSLLTVVLDNLTFDQRRAYARCREENLGAFALANDLTLRHGISWRTAQILAGRYITERQACGAEPGGVDAPLLQRLAGEYGFPVPDAEHLLRDALDPEVLMRRKVSAGSTAPARVRDLLAAQDQQLAGAAKEWTARAEAAQAVFARVDAALAGPAADHVTDERAGQTP